MPTELMRDIPESVLAAGGDALPSAMDLDMRPGLWPVMGGSPQERAEYLRKTMDDLMDEVGVSRASFSFDRLAGRIPPVLAAAIDKAGGEQAVAAALTRFLRTREIALLRNLGRLAEEDLPQAPSGTPRLLVNPHIGPPMANALHTALHGGRVVVPTYRYATPSPYLVLKRFPEMVPFPESASIRVVPVPHPLASYRLDSAVRSGMDMIWQPDTTVGGSSERSRTSLSLFGTKYEISIMPYLLMTKYSMPVRITYSRLQDDGTVEFYDEPLDPPTDSAERFVAYIGELVEDLVVRHVDQWGHWKFFPNL